MKKTTKYTMILLTVIGMIYTGTTYAAKDTPTQLVAETIVYNSNNKVVTAKGNVKITQAALLLTGPEAEYHSDTGKAQVTGGITMKNDETRITGERVDYDTNSVMGIVTGAPRMDNNEGAWMTATKMEFFGNEDQAIAIGNVHIVHPDRQIDATSDRATYYGKEKKVVLTGNPRAIQEGNTLIGETLTMYLDNSTMDAQGSTKLIIIPNDKPQEAP